MRKLFQNGTLQSLQTMLTRQSSRGFATAARWSNNSEFESEITKIFEKFDKHQAANHPFFDFLKEESLTRGLTTGQYDIFRINMLYRTQYTIPSAAHIIINAAMQGDHETIATASRIIMDEGGAGDPDKVHSNLLLQCINLHGYHIFGLQKINFQDAQQSDLLLPAAKEFRQHQLKVYKSSCYMNSIATICAHEGRADGMLKSIKEGIFDSYQGYYTQEEFAQIEEFFKAHHDEEVEGGDIEDQHRQMTMAMASRACDGKKPHLERLERVGTKFLDHQAQLWTQMLESMEKARSNGRPIKPVPLEIQTIIEPKNYDSVQSDSRSRVVTT